MQNMKTTFTKPAGLLLALTFSGVVAANSQMIYSNNAVPANAEIYGAGNAGLPDGSGVPPAEFNLPVNATVLSMVSVTGIITFNNGTGHNDADGPIVSGGYYGPTINGTTGYSVAGDYGGISGITMPGAGALVGVFASADAPTGAPPASLDFTSIGTAFTNLSPALYQTFFIGDGQTGDGSGAVQLFFVPAGASRLFLGISDAPGFYGSPGAYDDNFGTYIVSFQVSSVAPVEIQPPQLSGTNFIFSFQTVTNQSYTVLSTTNLASGTWTTNTIFIGDGTLKQLNVPSRKEAEFFRIREP
jgi:hypothetical protein